MPKSLDALRGTVADAVIDAALTASAELRKHGIPHALAGGLAVAAHGYPRATADVDFLVDDRAFEHHGAVVTLKVPLFQVGAVRVDFVSLPDRAAFARAAVDDAFEDAEPVVTVGMLVYMKLRAGRMRDLSDVAELLKRGALHVDAVTAFLRVVDDTLLPKWQAVREQAEGEAE